MTIRGTPTPRKSLSGNSAESLRFRGAFAANLRRIATSKQMSLPDVARLAGMKADRIYSITSGIAGTQAIELAVLAKVLEVSMDELVKGGVE